MEISRAIVQGSVSAVSMVKKYLSLPSLTSVLPVWNLRLETTSAVQTGEARVSENVIVATGFAQADKKVIADNVAPGPWEWRLEGYIPGSPLEVTNLYTPFLKMNIARLKAAYKNGTLLAFKDGDNNIYPSVAIKHLAISQAADKKNKRAFSMVLREIETISGGIVGSFVNSAASIAAGTAQGAAVSVGTSGTTAIPFAGF